MVASFVAGTTIYKYTQKIYESNSKFVYLKSNTESFGNLSSIAQLAGLTSNSTDVNVYIKDIIHSNDFLKKLINEIELTNIDGKKVDMYEVLDIVIDSSATDFENLRSQVAIAVLKKNILYIKDRYTGVTTVTTSFNDPVVAYQVNVYLVEQLRQIIGTITTRDISTRRDFLKTYLDSAHVALEKSENKLESYLKANIVLSTPQQRIQEQRLQRDITIKQEIYIQLYKQYEITRVNEAQKSPLIEIIDYPLVPILHVTPKKKLIMLMSILLGVVVSLVFLIIKDLIQKELEK